MNLFVLGATGHTGKHIVDLALARGHRVTAFVRSPDRVARTDRGLTIVKGDPLDPVGMVPALVGHDAVLSALGLPPREALRPSMRMAEFAAATVAAMTTSGVNRLGIVSAAVLFPLRGLRYSFFRWLLRHHARDLTAMETVVKATSFAWTIARPGRLTDSPQETYRAEDEALPSGAFSMSFRAVAAFLLDAVERDQHARKVVGLARAA